MSRLKNLKSERTVGMRTLILGAGGIGGYYGGRLASADVDVTFLVREHRVQRLRERGLVIESPLGSDKIDIDVVTSATLEAPYDLVVLSCKAFDLDSAIEAIRPAVGETTTILPLLNGVAHLDRLDAAFGAERVIGGCAHISVTMWDDGSIHHLNKLDLLTYGERHKGAAPDRCDAIERLFAKAMFEPRRSDVILQEMWEKFAFITAASAITCLMRANIGQILATEEGGRLARAFLDECAAVAEAEGFRLRDKAREWGASVLTTPSAFTASMLRDLEAGQAIEADMLQGDMIRRGAAHDVAIGNLRVAYCHLQTYQNRRADESHRIAAAR